MAEIRPMRESDIPAFREALNAVASERRYILTLEAPPLEDVRKFVLNSMEKGYPQFVAEVDGLIVGWSDFVSQGKQSLSHSANLGMGVIKEYRRKGIGDALLIAVTHAALDRGFVRLELEVFANNEAAIALYKKHGFELEGTKRRARKIDGAYIDTHKMSKIYG